MKKFKVLVVEDEPGIADSLIYILNSEGFEALWADTLNQARDLFSSEMPDFLILDIGLPDGTGIDFCKEIRDFSNVPILFLTARQEELDKVIALEVGGDDYVTKPFSGREVTARVKAILRRSQGASDSKGAGFEGSSLGGSEVKGVGENAGNLNESEVLVLSEVSQKFLLHGKALDLSRNEFYLLKLLWKNPGRIYSRSQIMNAVWEEPEASMERTVDSHIKSIRKKLGNFHCIHTQRGFGYKFEILGAADMDTEKDCIS